jgi:hypothetical protein
MDLSVIKQVWDNIFKLQQATEYNTRSIRDIYPDTAIMMWINSTMDSTEDPATFIPDSFDGYVDELQELGQGSTAPGTTSKANLANNPYSIIQRPLTNFEPVIRSQNVYLEKIEYYAYDTTISGGLGQDPAVVAAIYASRTGDDIIPQSYFQNGMFPGVNWQPNFFRPSFQIDGEEMLKGLQASQYGNKNNQGDLSIGMPLPACYNINKALGKITNGVNSLAQLGQLVDVGGTNYVQRYPILTIATFRLGSRKNSY